MAKKGHKKLAFAIDSVTPSNNNKLKGFTTGMLRLGINKEDILVYDATSNDMNPEMAIKRGYNITSEILKENPDIEGIIYTVDLLAIGGLQFLESKNISVPNKVAVIGVDNALYGKICRPTLTTLDNKLVEVSQNACKILLDALSKKIISHKIMLCAEIIERESS